MEVDPGTTVSESKRTTEEDLKRASTGLDSADPWEINKAALFLKNVFERGASIIGSYVFVLTITDAVFTRDQLIEIGFIPKIIELLNGKSNELPLLVV
jgi:hypothetical protein